jgi:cytochrome c5
MNNKKFHTLFHKGLKYKTVFIFLIIFCSGSLYSQNWEVPAEKKVKSSSFVFNSETESKGQSLYERNCQQCHGTPGKGNFIKLVPVPKDPASNEYQSNTDGELFYKMTTGRGTMPSFLTILNEEERWDIISYVRSFNAGYKQTPIEESKARSGKNAIIAINPMDSGRIEICVTEKVHDKNIPVINTGVTLFTKRYFGNLRIGNTGYTNKEGKVYFQFPVGLPGDKEGKVELIVKLNDEEQFGDIQKKDILTLGVPTQRESLVAHRAMWNISVKAPWWLILSYLSLVLLVWGFIFYIVYLLYKIKKISD